MEEPGTEATANPIDKMITSCKRPKFRAYYFFRWNYSIVDSIFTGPTMLYYGNLGKWPIRSYSVFLLPGTEDTDG